MIEKKACEDWISKLEAKNAETLGTLKGELAIASGNLTALEGVCNAAPTINSIEMTQQGLVTLRFSQITTVYTEDIDYTKILQLTVLSQTEDFFKGRYSQLKPAALDFTWHVKSLNPLYLSIQVLFADKIRPSRLTVSILPTNLIIGRDS